MTDPTADAAKLLPLITAFANAVDRASFADGANASQERRNHLHAAKDTAMGNLLDAVGRLATRPQPAPPAGEPDFHRWLDQKIAEWAAAGGFHDFAVAAKVIRDRLGQASRPKVEDAEVAAAITYLGDEVPEEKAIADLLERLAGEAADNLKAAQGMSADVTNIGQQLQVAKSKLAEREAELAKAEAFISDVSSFPGSALALDLRETISVRQRAIKNHAARQQQKASAEPKAREGE